MCAPFPSGPGGAAEAPNVGPSTLCSYRQRVPGRRAPPTSDVSRLLTHFFVFPRCQKSISVQPRYGPKGQAGSRLWIPTAQPLSPPSGGLHPLRGRCGIQALDTNRTATHFSLLAPRCGWAGKRGSWGVWEPKCHIKHAVNQ